MAGASAEDVRGTLHKLLTTVDFNVTTERQVRLELHDCEHPYCLFCLSALWHCPTHSIKQEAVLIRMFGMQIRDTLAEQLGTPMDPYKMLIKVGAGT